MDVNAMYECETAAQFVEWFDANIDILIGNYPAKSEALKCAVEILRRIAAEQ